MRSNFYPLPLIGQLLLTPGSAYNECALCGHALEASATLTDVQHAPRIVPTQFDRSVGPLLVAIAIPLVIVQSERRIRTRIHIDNDGQVALRPRMLRHLRRGND